MSLSSISSNLQCLRPECLLSRFLPRAMRNREKYLPRLCSKLMQSRLVFRKKRGDIRPLLQTVLLVRQRAFRTAFHIWCLPIRQEILNVSLTAVTFHRTRPPFVTQTGLHATAPQMSLLSLCALLSRQSHLFLICVVLTYNDSRMIPRKTCQIPRNCQCK